MAHRNRACHGGGTPQANSSRCKRARFAAWSPCVPAYSALCTPGSPPSASTSSPESSLRTSPGKICEAASALIRAFSANVSPVSSGAGISGYPVKSTTSHADPSMARISAVLWAFFVAMSRRRMGRVVPVPRAGSNIKRAVATTAVWSVLLQKSYNARLGRPASLPYSRRASCSMEGAR